MERRKDTLLLTGWGLPVYPPAAALALRCAFDMRADVLGVSRRYVAKTLLEEGVKYDNVWIIGVGLDVDPDKNAAALLQLKDAGIRVRWISGMELKPELAREYQPVDGWVFCGKPIVDERGLLKAVQKAFGKKIGDEDVEYYEAYAAPNPKESTDYGKYRKLFDAADWMHKTYRELWHYTNAIKSLAERVPPSSFRQDQIKVRDFYEKWGKRRMLGVSEHMREVEKFVERAAKHDAAEARVLITGPSGTGKETVAQQIHMKSSRKHGPFLSFNCACATKDLFETKLFGHVKGAFTGAVADADGLFATAEGGTLFLDEIGEMDKELQGYLLRVLQDGEYQKVGSPVVHRVKDVRLITATNRALVKAVNDGDFREDLYHRLNVLQVRMKSLREHPEDIAVIADGLWFRDTKKHLSEKQLKALAEYDYPGNARELENMLVRARSLEIDDFAQLVEEQRKLNAGLDHAVPDDPDTENLDSVIRAHVRKVYKRYKGKITQKRIAVEHLGVSENTMKKYLE